MMCCGKERGKYFWIKVAIFMPIAIVVGVFIFGSAIMYLWNAILSDVLGVTTINFWQALGILVLSKILFGGFRGGHKHHSHNHHKHAHEWHANWKNMSQEEKEKLKVEWKNRCCAPNDKE